MSAKVAAIAHKLYEARRACRGIAREEYGARVAEYMQIIHERTGPETDYLHVGMKCVEILTGGGYDVPAMWTLAAIVELIEPDEQTPAWEPKA